MAVTALRHPETLLVMQPSVRDLQFGPAEVTRLRATATLGRPLATDDLENPAVRRRLAEIEVMVTSWGCPPLDQGVGSGSPPESRVSRGWQRPRSRG